MHDEALVEAVLSGETHRFEELVTAYKDKIYNMACRFTRNTDEGEDLAQDIFLLIYRNLKSFKGQSKLSTWIYRLSLNRCLDWQRKNKLKNRLQFFASAPRNECRNILDQIPSPQITPEESAIRKEQRAVLHAAIGQLSENYQKVIILYHFQNLSYREIAEILDLPVKTVETRLYRGKQKLKDILNKKQKQRSEVKDYGLART